jgi:hypothetical protein
MTLSPIRDLRKTTDADKPMGGRNASARSSFAGRWAVLRLGMNRAAELRPSWTKMGKQRARNRRRYPFGLA